MSETNDDLSLRSTGTLTLWLTCLIVGAVGLVYPHGPQPFQMSIKTVQAIGPNTSIEVVQMTPQPTDPQSSSVQPHSASAALIPVADNVPPLSQIAMVPPASPFLVPQKIVPVRTTATNISSEPRTDAASSVKTGAARPQSTAYPMAAGSTAAVQQLVFGQGEGKQPPPVYPRESQLGRQEGTVMVRFSIDSTGSVTNATAVTRCPWPLLNQAAVRTVKDTWHFASGEARTFDVAIRFQLQRR